MLITLKGQLGAYNIIIVNTCYKGSLQLIDASNMSCNVVAIWRPCFIWVMPAVCLVILLLSGETMLRVGRASSMSCNVVAVWRSCFMHVLSAVCLVTLLLSGDHALCGLCQQHVL